ncbi:hypothetical protein HXX76_014140 [Chlamydomonas incerta]|uniref:Endonuclease n=1 Tax=Chlamydomonas incerta TaxID=51695 RepID=A0A835SHI8_CHLIN|nr:hypothetical protein HXX76_014140 [Chlamydomonas incerta]|eukprot:KAG2424982.1 hypothetical protein HXX76_014140 [Chlamydomonas incerta]
MPYIRTPSGYRKKTCLLCDSSPSYGFDGYVPQYCAKHKDEVPGLVNVKHPRCQAPGCIKRPSYGVLGTKEALFCGEHGRKAGLVDVIHRRCQVPGCNKQPSYGESGTKKALFCEEHSKEARMVDVVNPRCKQDGCDTRISGIAKKYGGMCFRCYYFNNPDEPVCRAYKSKEMRVVEFLEAADLGLPDGISPVLDKAVSGGCSRRRPDFLLDLHTHTIILEIDENQHGAYDTTCETKRLMELFCDLGSRPMVVVRFNPDRYTAADGTKHAACFQINAKLGVPKACSTPEWTRRSKYLLERMCHHVEDGINNGAPDKELTVEHLFFDGME